MADLEVTILMLLPSNIIKKKLCSGACTLEKSLKLLFDPPNLETLGTLKNINPAEMSDGAKTKYLLVKGNSKDNVYCNKYYHFMLLCTICPRSSDPFYIVTYYIKWGYYFLDIQ